MDERKWWGGRRGNIPSSGQLPSISLLRIKPCPVTADCLSTDNDLHTHTHTLVSSTPESAALGGRSVSKSRDWRVDGGHRKPLPPSILFSLKLAKCHLILLFKKENNHLPPPAPLKHKPVACPTLCRLFNFYNFCFSFDGSVYIPLIHSFHYKCIDISGSDC